MDYHCNTKFKSLQVHVQGRMLYNCHKAFPERVDIDWLEANPGMLFHTDTMLKDRKLMLDNKSCASCHHGCFKYEEKGLLSNRLLEKGNEEKIVDPQNGMQVLQVILSTDCNLACVYCTPELSTSWQREITKGGEYSLGKHSIKNDNWTLLWSKMKQKSRSTQSKFFSLLLREITLAKSLKKLSVIGGEPLLSNQLFELVQIARDQQIATIEIVTGLGVSPTRLSGFLEKTKGTRIKFSISAESTNKFFEFIRYGSDWTNFKAKIERIKSFGHDVEFISTMSNICLFDYHNFYNQFSDKGRIVLNPIGDRPHLAPHVMDDESKQKCGEYILNVDDAKQREVLSAMISIDPDDDERKILGSYLRQLSARRKIGLEFLPEHFLRWCGAIA
jgi:hypothetical protein